MEQKSVNVSDTRKYAFNWERLGDLALGRPNLGPSTRVEAYRLFQFALRDSIEASYGSVAADDLFRAAGRMAGTNFFKHIVAPCGDLSSLLSRLPVILESLGIGIFRVEQFEPEAGILVFTVAEDLDCSGLPECGFSVCTYDEGFFEGLFREAIEGNFRIVEKDCWCTGERICRFVMTLA